MVHISQCLDYEGFIWSFGQNEKGQLGTVNTTNYNVPQKILDIPPVYFVACGSEHTLVITNDLKLWSCGANSKGQLCQGNVINSPTFVQTSFSGISRVSLGGKHSLFQTQEGGEIYACGRKKKRRARIGYYYHSSNYTNTHSKFTSKYCSICLWI